MSGCSELEGKRGLHTRATDNEQFSGAYAAESVGSIFPAEPTQDAANQFDRKHKRAMHGNSVSERSETVLLLVDEESGRCVQLAMYNDFGIRYHEPNISCVQSNLMLRLSSSTSLSLSAHPSTTYYGST